MKLIHADNFDRENRSEKVIAENVSEYWAEKIAEALNKRFSGNHSDFYCAIQPDDYQPKTYSPV